MLQIVHNANTVNEVAKKDTKRERSDFARQFSFKLFKKACEVNMERIAKIQEKYPDWEPKFNYKG